MSRKLTGDRDIFSSREIELYCMRSVWADDHMETEIELRDIWCMKTVMSFRTVIWLKTAFSMWGVNWLNPDRIIRDRMTLKPSIQIRQDGDPNQGPPPIYWQEKWLLKRRKKREISRYDLNKLQFEILRNHQGEILITSEIKKLLLILDRTSPRDTWSYHQGYIRNVRHGHWKIIRREIPSI